MRATFTAYIEESIGELASSIISSNSPNMGHCIYMLILGVKCSPFDTSLHIQCLPKLTEVSMMFSNIYSHGNTIQ